MSIFCKTHVEFSLCVKGRLLRDFAIFEVGTRDISKVSIPKTAFGYRFFDVVFEVHDDGTFNSERVNFTPFHYFGVTLYTIAQAKKDFIESRNFLEKMNVYGSKKMIRTKTGFWQIFYPKDQIIKRPRTKRVFKAPNKKL